ncbi:putative zinc-binding dehydrogenase family oxidoreductase [Pseudomassariella vexata]|uniref:Putative zinc-binding dehydrogenase family oxidoreductase n=1 Tax=Pseudomassariella vexata TaxID=1141098 RepID=A0A1Y2E8B4_9PEZI|nr:putative zinc-binding dehydrogenase family oxidoreductase [Pseudomassariella vexata]ORY67813.1 putative zinc-binding dehydrogenase family oxidoreductase [Pseudomassariella vexata]
MIELPRKQKALIGLEDGSLGVSNDVDVPEIEEDMVMVKTRAMGLNPIDTKMKGVMAAPGAVAGMDFAGEVVAVGSKFMTPAKIGIGDRVCGAVIGYHKPTPAIGAFAEFVGAKDVGLLKIPDDWSFEQGASLGCAISTIGLALFKSLNVPGTPKSPAEKPVDVFVYGGSTSTGTLALQLLKLSGLNPITVCSPHNVQLVKSYGATAVFDYKQPSCIQDIRKHTRNSLKYVLDCVSEPETMEFCYKCLARTGGKYTALEPFPKFLHTRPRTIVPDWVLGPSVLGQEIGWPEPFTRKQNEDLRNFGIEWYITVQKLLDDGQLRPHPVRVVDGGFGGVPKGVELLRKKQVSGQKLVCILP